MPEPLQQVARDESAYAPVPVGHEQKRNADHAEGNANKMNSEVEGMAMPLPQFGAIRSEDGALLKEYTVTLGHIPEVRADNVRLVLGCSTLKRLFQSQQL